MIKKIFSVYLVLCLLVTNVIYASSYMNDSILSNVTPMGIYEDPTNKTKYLYGGNVIFKFKDSSKGVMPLFTFSTPSIKAGCNGISVSSGMLSMLGLDGIADQIQNAGTAVVYGIIVGLIYSLPALEKVFAHIRKWAQWIQSLLRSACAQGEALGKCIAKESGFKDATGQVASVLTNAVNSGTDFFEIPKMMPEKATGQELTNFIDRMLSGSGTTSTTGKEQDDQKTSHKKNWKEYFIRLGLANIILYKPLVKDGSYTLNAPTYINIIPNGDEQKELYLLLVNMFGELSIDEKSIEFLNEFGGFMIDMVSREKSNNEAARKKYAKQIAELTQSASSIILYSTYIIP